MSALASALRKFNETKTRERDREEEDGEVQEEEDEEELLAAAYKEMRGLEEPSTSYAVIPKFYSALPKEDQLLRQKLRAAARTSFLRKMNSELMTHEELQRLWEVLEELNSPPRAGDELMIHYQDFVTAGTRVSEKCKKYFTPSTFAKLLREDTLGRVAVMHLFNYIMKTEWLKQTRISLSLFDVQGLGFLRETDLENYVLELIPTLPQLSSLEESFYSFYVCTAVRRFFFFLDPLRTGRIKIQDILACGFLDDLLELRDDELSKEQQEANWFSAPSALRVYGQYLSLDTDHNGMLSKAELLKYGTGTLTGVFVNRIFQECLTYDGEVDYKTYLDFILAMENRGEPQSLQYFFRLLDLRACGYLDAFTLKYFFRAIQDMMMSQDQEPVSFEDVKDEIFDMVKPADPQIITLVDLTSSGQGETVVSILTDLQGFWMYENREMLLAENTTDQ